MKLPNKTILHFSFQFTFRPQVAIKSFSVNVTRHRKFERENEKARKLDPTNT